MSADASEANRDDGCEWYFGVPFPSKRAQATAPATQERELKVGDRVRASGGYTFDPVYGVVVGARGGGGYRVRAEALHADMGSMDTWTYYASELTLLPPPFASGARVRVIRNTLHYAVGDTGTVTVSSDESVGVHMDDGRYWSFKPEDLAVVPQDGTVTAEKLSVASLSTLAPDCSASKVEQDVGIWSYGGRRVIGAKPDGWPDNAFIGYQRQSAKQDNVIGASEIKARVADHVATVFGGTPEPCIVIRQVDGKPRPSSWPHVHQSAADATKEAERLASVNPGKQFDVYQRVTGRVAEQHIEMKVA